MIEEVGRHSGKYGYQESGTLIFIIEFFITIIIFMVAVFMSDPKEGINGWFILGVVIFWIANIVFLVFWVWVIPMKKQLQMQAVCDGVKLFMEGPWRRDRANKDDFFCGLKYLRKLDLKWEDTNIDGELTQLMQSPAYIQYKEMIVRGIFTSEFQAKSQKQREQEKGFFKRLQKSYEKYGEKVDLPPLPEEEKTDGINLEDPAKKEIIKQKNLIQQPYETFDPKDLTPEDIKLLNSLEFNFSEFYDVEKFRNYDVEMDCAIIVTKGPAGEILQTEPATGYHKGWEVQVNRVGVQNLVMNYVTENMPILYVAFSDNMLEPAIDIIERLSAKLLVYIDIKVMEMWINHLRSLGEQARKAMEVYKQDAEDWEQVANKLILKKLEHALVYGAMLADDQYQEVYEEKMKLQTKVKVSLVVIIAIIIIFVSIIIIGVAGGLSNPGPPKDLSLFSNLLQLLFYL